MGVLVRVVIAGALLLQATLVGVAVWARSPLLFVLGEMALVSLVLAVVVVTKYLRLRADYRRERHTAARLAERRRLADEVHDVVGHELSLIGMQAGLLELRTEGETAKLAAELRERAAGAVHALHESLVLLGEPGPREPVSSDLTRLVEQFRAAGGAVTLSGGIDTFPGPVQLAAHAVVREGLTNASRHAPGRPVQVTCEPTGTALRCEVVTSAAPHPRAGPGRGVATLARRVEALGGQLAVEHPTGDGGAASDHRLIAILPLRPRPALEDEVPPPPRPVRVMLRQLAVPVAAAVVIVTGFYVWASHGASIEPRVQSALYVGMPRAAAIAALPDRQAPVRLVAAPPHPAGWDCRDYTNGNFPLAVASLEVCLDAIGVTRLTNLAARRLW